MSKSLWLEFLSLTLAKFYCQTVAFFARFEVYICCSPHLEFSYLLLLSNLELAISSFLLFSFKLLLSLLMFCLLLTCWPLLDYKFLPKCFITLVCDFSFSEVSPEHYFESFVLQLSNPLGFSNGFSYSELIFWTVRRVLEGFCLFSDLIYRIFL